MAGFAGKTDALCNFMASLSTFKSSIPSPILCGLSAVTFTNIALEKTNHLRIVKKKIKSATTSHCVKALAKLGQCRTGIQRFPSKLSCVIKSWCVREIMIIPVEKHR